MKLPIGHELLVRAAVIAAACTGGWLLSVRPNAVELAQIQRKVADATVDRTSLGAQTVQELTSRMDEFRQRAAQFEMRNRLAEDSSRLYGLIMELAGAHRVRVTNLQPAPVRSNSADGQLSIAQLDVSVEGRFEDVAGFIDAVANIDTFIRPKSLQVMPVNAQGSKLVSARLGADVISFKNTQGLALLGDANYAQP